MTLVPLALRSVSVNLDEQSEGVSFYYNTITGSCWRSV